MPAPRFFVPSVDQNSTDVSLPPDEAHHLARVLRLGTGSMVRVFDGRGSEWHARVRSADGDDVRVDLVEPSAPAPEPPVRLTLSIGLLKGAQMDTVVRDATMLGVHRIVPIQTAHVARPAASRDTAGVSERWRRIAIGSAKQCGRAVVPEIARVQPLAGVLETACSNSTFTVMCVEPGLVADGRPTAWPADPIPTEAVALVGPEGGWSSGEVEAARRAGAQLMHLGPRTLRAEAAPAVLLSSLWTRWGW